MAFIPDSFIPPRFHDRRAFLFNCKVRASSASTEGSRKLIRGRTLLSAHDSTNLHRESDPQEPGIRRLCRPRCRRPAVTKGRALTLDVEISPIALRPSGSDGAARRSAGGTQAYLGIPNSVYEALDPKRGLSLVMIRRLNRGLRIPSGVLIAWEKLSGQRIKCQRLLSSIDFTRVQSQVLVYAGPE